ncbi:hypothetical protein R1sor_009226 [Riccia sorocarpa]|uniref:Uncharacterized protein n=1 Tax=Riccia sorocarpa TaxID=122646 RepID=A0ABD3H819_9MARC
MNFRDLNDPEIMLRVQAAWNQELVSVRDDRRRWSRVAEQKLKDQELHDAKMWLIRSREKWLQEDEVPSRHFFAKLKSKWARESLTTLTLPDGEVTSDNQVILEEIHRYFQSLYTAEPESSQQVEAREDMLSLIRNRLSPVGSQAVSAKPDKAEIEAVVFAMKNNKSPGIDGLMVEVVKICWDTEGDDYVRMVPAVCAKRRLLKTEMQGVIKLLQKGGDVLHL